VARQEARLEVLQEEVQQEVQEVQQECALNGDGEVRRGALSMEMAGLMMKTTKTVPAKK
jgi:hypothetical protein